MSPLHRQPFESPSFMAGRGQRSVTHGEDSDGLVVVDEVVKDSVRPDSERTDAGEAASELVSFVGGVGQLGNSFRGSVTEQEWEHFEVFYGALG